MLMKLSRFSSRQSNRYWSLYLKSSWKGLLCHIWCVMLQLPFHRKEWSWMQEKLRNEIQCNLRYTVWFILHEFRRYWQSKRAVSWMSGHSCAAKSRNVSSIQHWKGLIGHLFSCSCIWSPKIICFVECNDICLHYVSQTEQHWARLEYQRWHCGWEPEGVIGSATTHLWPHACQWGGVMTLC